MFLPQVMPSEMADTYPFGWASVPSMTVADGKNSVAIWRGLTRSVCSYASCQTPTLVIAGTHYTVVANVLHGFIASRMMPGASFE